MSNDRPTKRDRKTGKELEGYDLGVCNSCHGTGDDPKGRKDRVGDLRPCVQCEGRGRIYEWKLKSGN